jgi:transglutaminase-like putative cysteine protease
VIYDIRHVTNYAYEFPISSATLSLRVTPRSGLGQHCLDHALIIDPPPASLRAERDFFGNAVTMATIETALVTLTVEARARVDVSRPAIPQSVVVPMWTDIVEQALAETSLDAEAPVHFLFASPYISLSPQVTAYAAQSFPAGRSIVDGARDFARRIRAEFAYSPQVTDVSTPLDQAFAQRRGVCQDFAHIMIAGLRGLGLPAAYVSGYIRTIPPPGKERLEGADATHAWVSVWCGPTLGWFGIDPTNAIDVGNDNIVLAIGRDFSDVSPILGVFVGSGAQELEVGVDVVPVQPARAR